jgi:hypothetical protein
VQYSFYCRVGFSSRGVKCNHVWACVGQDLALIDWPGARRSQQVFMGLVRSTRVVLVRMRCYPGMSICHVPQSLPWLQACYYNQLLCSAFIFLSLSLCFVIEHIVSSCSLASRHFARQLSPVARALVQHSELFFTFEEGGDKTPGIINFSLSLQYSLLVS